MVRIHRSLSPDPRTPRQEEGTDGVVVMSTRDNGNEASRLQDSTRLHQNTKNANSSASDFASVPDTIPLDVLFTICSGKHGWLTIQDKKVNVKQSFHLELCKYHVLFSFFIQVMVMKLMNQ